jgi:hypothetical protein
MNRFDNYSDAELATFAVEGFQQAALAKAGWRETYKAAGEYAVTLCDRVGYDACIQALRLRGVSEKTICTGMHLAGWRLPKAKVEVDHTKKLCDTIDRAWAKVDKDVVMEHILALEGETT